MRLRPSSSVTSRMLRPSLPGRTRTRWARPADRRRPRAACVTALRSRPSAARAPARCSCRGIRYLRVGQPMHRFAVGGEQQQPGRHDVEPAHVGEPAGVLDEVEHRAPARFVVRGGDHAQRLVEGEPARGPCRRIALPRDRDLLLVGIHLHPERRPPWPSTRTLPASISSSAARRRRDPGPRQGPLQPHLAHDSAGT